MLKAAGIERAAILASVVSDDASNVFLTITAHELNPSLIIYSRAEQLSTIKKLQHVGATKVISPAHIGADRLAHLILTPTAESILQQSHLPEGLNEELEDLGLKLDELEIPAGSILCGKTLLQAQSEVGHGLLTVAVKSSTGSIKLSPLLTDALQANDVWIVMGRKEDLTALRRTFQLSSRCEEGSSSASGDG